jgi:5-methylcytosine-specific restriction protein A
MPALRLCIDCGTPCNATRCSIHQRIRDNATLHGKRARRPYTNAEQARRAATVQAWRAWHGDWCPGWQRAPHAATDLTADHITPVAAGGSEDGPLTVLCRACNGSKGAGGTP